MTVLDLARRRIRCVTGRAFAAVYGVMPVGLVGQVTVTPSTDGMPGANFVRQLLGWVAQISLWGCLISILGGGAYWGLSQHAGNSFGASKGKTLVLGGVIGAAVCGGAAIIVNTLYAAAQS